MAGAGSPDQSPAGRRDGRSVDQPPVGRRATRKRKDENRNPSTQNVAARRPRRGVCHSRGYESPNREQSGEGRTVGVDGGGGGGDGAGDAEAVEVCLPLAGARMPRRWRNGGVRMPGRRQPDGEVAAPSR